MLSFVPVKTVIYFKASERSADRAKLAGIREVAKAEGWNLQVVMPALAPDTVRDVLELWHPDGSILSCGSGLNDMRSSLFKSVPIVYLDRPKTQIAKNDSYVLHDAAATARLAVRELLNLGLEHFAYVPWDGSTRWDNDRRQAFAATLRLHGLSCATFATDTRPDTPQRLIPELVRWLARLPKPLGVFAAADPAGAQVLEACRLAGISVPADVAVVSVNNDQELCESCNPSLSSIDLGFSEAGRIAAETLKRLMSRRTSKPIRATYRPVGLERRTSTLRLIAHDQAVIDALELIRGEACNGLTARKVLTTFPCSRRMAELRFRTQTGKSVLEVILDTRLKRAKELLARKAGNLEAIANFCGYSSLSAFTMFFKSATGLPPSRWHEQRTDPHA